MSTMPIQVNLPANIADKLRSGAAACGEDVPTYAGRLLEVALTAPSMDELLRPFRKQVEESGLSDEELDRFYEGLRDKVWNARPPRKTA